MTHRFAPLTIALLAALSALGFAPAAANDVAVLPLGRYACATPGTAAGATVIDVPDRGFTVVRGSSYITADGAGGTYLLASDMLTFTRGPLVNLRLRKTREGLWREVGQDGTSGRLRCSRVGGIAAP